MAEPGIKWNFELPDYSSSNLNLSTDGSYLGMQQLNTYKQSLKQSQDQFNKNYAAQAQTTNASLEDRQRARLATGGNYQSVGDYMNQHRIA